MKRTLILLWFICFSLLSSAQDIKKQLEELDTAFAHDDYELALTLVDKIYPSLSLIKDDTVYVEFLNTAGSLCYRLNQYTRAEEFLKKASQKALQSLGEKDYRYPLALFNLAAVYKEQGRYVEAEPLYLQSLPELANVFGQSSLQYTRCFYSLATLYVDMGKYQEAEGMCAAAVNFYKVILGESSSDYRSAMGLMALIYQGLAKYDKAEEIFLAMKKYHSSLATPSKETLQVLENNLGELYRRWGDYEKAEPYLINAVAMAGDSTESTASSLNNLGLVQKALGNYEGAERSYERSIAIYISLGKTDHPDYSNPINNLGELYRTMGRLQEAVYAFEEAIALRKKLLGTDHPNYANALNNLALVESYIGMYSEAERDLLECKEIYKKILGEKDKFYLNCLNNLASVYNQQGKYPLAEQTYKECLRVYKENYNETNDRYGLYLGGLAATYRLMKKYDEAIALTLRSMEVLKNKLGVNHYDYIETEYHLAETYREAGNYIEAEKHCHNSMKGYLLLIEKYFPYLSENDKTAFYFTVAAAFEAFNSFVIQMRSEFPKANHDALITRMYNNQVAMKSLLLREAESVRELVASSNIESVRDDYQQWIKLRETIVQHYRLSAEEVEAKGISIPVLELQANELEQRMASALKTTIKKENNKSILWTDIQKGLKPGEYAVEIIRTDLFYKGRWTDTVCYAALIIDNKCTVPTFVLLSNGKLLEEKSMAYYRRSIRARLADDISYDAFWKPFKEYLINPTRIYFSADGLYQQLNLNTLKNPVTGKYLIEEADIRLVSNTKDILQAPVQVVSKTASLFSFPDYGGTTATNNSTERIPGFPELRELPGTKIESDSIKAILSGQGWKVKEYLQKQAAEDSIKLVKSPQVLHIATHGFFLKDVIDSTGDVLGMQSEIAKQNPLLRSGLALAGAAATARERNGSVSKEDGILTAYEAIGLDLSNTDLVVLSACETGLGEMLNGQGVYGLQRAFLVAGARSVIMSLWMVDDFATQELMTNFYREWLKDPTAENKYKAFRTAQLQLKAKLSSPYYWGAFVIVGD